MEKPLVIKNNSIYSSVGLVENCSIIIDKKVGLIKYGSEKEVRAYYDTMMSRYKQMGLNEIGMDLMFISFNEYNGNLTNKEICTFINYMYMVSANHIKIMQLIEMNIDSLKKELKKYADLDF